MMNLSTAVSIFNYIRTAPVGVLRAMALLKRMRFWLSYCEDEGSS